MPAAEAGRTDFEMIAETALRRNVSENALSNR
jgi:hypothetical protein